MRSMVRERKKERKKESTKRKLKAQSTAGLTRKMYQATFCGSFENEVSISKLCKGFKIRLKTQFTCCLFGQTSLKERLFKLKNWCSPKQLSFLDTWSSVPQKPIISRNGYTYSGNFSGNIHQLVLVITARYWHGWRPLLPPHLYLTSLLSS